MSQAFNASDAAFYGLFVKAAAQMNKDNPGNLRPDLPKDFPSDWELEGWITMRDRIHNGPLEPKPVFYGIVARDTKNTQKHVIAFRGTDFGNPDEVASDADPTPMKYPGPGSLVVVGGFYDPYQTMQIDWKIPPTPREFVDTAVVTGHSLGSALATYYTMEYCTTVNRDINKFPYAIKLVSTLASPKVGSEDFASLYNTLTTLSGTDISTWRIINDRDDVPNRPDGYRDPVTGELKPYKHVVDPPTYSFNSKTYANLGETCAHSINTYLYGLYLLNQNDPRLTGIPVEWAKDDCNPRKS
jgi:triacylglycerol lipase